MIDSIRNKTKGIMDKILRSLSKIIIIGIAVFVYLYTSIFIAKRNLDTTFYIIKGDQYTIIVQNLKKQNIISNEFAFKVYSSFVDTSNIKAGKYEFKGKYNIPKIFKVLNEETISTTETRNVTIIEGWNKYDVSKYLSNEFNIEYNYVLDFIKNGYKKTDLAKTYTFLNNKEIKDLEGFIYPDTYEVYDNSNLEMIFDKILSNFKNKVADVYKLENKKLYEILKIASIIEEEAKLDADRPIVSGIIQNRLKNDMKLQIDATVIYFTQNKENIAKDKNINNPYNTYTNKGLPIGPIANPGISSINAAINPVTTDYLFYINKDSGEAVYAKTLEEHNRNIRAYLR